MTGREATLAIMKELEGVDFQPSIYSHAIGHHGHAVGPSLSARDMKLGVRPEEDSVLRPGAHCSIEFSARTAVPEWNGETVLIPMEDDAYLTEKGYVLLQAISDRVVFDPLGSGSTRIYFVLALT